MRKAPKPRTMKFEYLPCIIVITKQMIVNQDIQGMMDIILKQFPQFAYGYCYNEHYEMPGDDGSNLSFETEILDLNFKRIKIECLFGEEFPPGYRDRWEWYTRVKEKDPIELGFLHPRKHNDDYLLDQPLFKLE